MNEREVSEIRRRMRTDKNNVRYIYGCYVNERKEIISQFAQSVALMPEDEKDLYFSFLKKGISGTLGKNLVDITFSTKQVVDSDEHRLLMAMKTSSLEDAAAREEFFTQVIQNAAFEDKYLILLAADTYDVPYRGKDGDKFDEASNEVFTYFVCSICPVKETKTALSYYVPENVFHNSKGDWIASPPEIGFMFPAFDDRSSNIYNALYYTKDTAQNHSEFVDAVFKTEIPMPPDEQKEAFSSVLGDTLQEDCSFDVAATVHEKIGEMLVAHKENKIPEPLKITKNTVKDILGDCGVSDEHIESFDEKFDDEFGSQAEVSPKSIIDPKKLELKTPDVVIKVSTDKSDLVETRVIDGHKYILINADEGVELNGIRISIAEEE